MSLPTYRFLGVAFIASVLTIAGCSKGGTSSSGGGELSRGKCTDPYCYGKQLGADGLPADRNSDIFWTIYDTDGSTYASVLTYGGQLPWVGAGRHCSDLGASLPSEGESVGIVDYCTSSRAASKLCGGPPYTDRRKGKLYPQSAWTNESAPDFEGEPRAVLFKTFPPNAPRYPQTHPENPRPFYCIKTFNP